ncbi:MAG: hypothetical protein ACYDGN_02670 [Acidimicrobiales bacterium]
MVATRVLPVTSLLASSLPFGGLQRGTTTIVSPTGAGEGMQVAGSTTLALELLAGVSMDGHWCAAVGLADLGLLAAAGRGIALDRLLLVPFPGGAGRWQQVLAALFDGVEAVLFAPVVPVRPADARKLSVRAKNRGSTLIVLDRHRYWSEPGDLRCSVVSSTWSGLGEGHGLLSARSVEIEVSGRGAAARPLRSALSLSQVSRIA